MSNVTFTTLQIDNNFAANPITADLAVNHFSPTFSNTGITVDFQASSIDWTGAIRTSNVVNSTDITANTPQVTVQGNSTQYGLTQVSLEGLTLSDASAVKAFSLITILGNTDPQGNIYDVPYANFQLSGYSYSANGNLISANANFAISGFTSNAGANAITGKFYIDIPKNYFGNTQPGTPVAATTVRYQDPYWIIGDRNGLLSTTLDFINPVNTYKVWPYNMPIYFLQDFGNKTYIGGGRAGYRFLYSSDYANGAFANISLVNSISNVGTPVQAYSNGNTLLIGVDEGENQVLWTNDGNIWNNLPGNANVNLTATHAIDYNSTSNTWTLFFGDMESAVGANVYYEISNLSSNTFTIQNFNTGANYYVLDAVRNGNTLALAARYNPAANGVILYNTSNTWQHANLSFVPWGISYIQGNYYAYGGQQGLIGDTIGAGPGIVARSTDLATWSNVVSDSNQFVSMGNTANSIVIGGYNSGLNGYWNSNISSNTWIYSGNVRFDRTQTLTIPAYDVFGAQILNLNYGNSAVINSNVVINTMLSALNQGNAQEYTVSQAQYQPPTNYNQDVISTLGVPPGATTDYIQLSVDAQKVAMYSTTNRQGYLYYYLDNPGVWTKNTYAAPSTGSNITDMRMHPASGNLYNFYYNSNGVGLMTVNIYDSLNFANTSNLGTSVAKSVAGVTDDEQNLLIYDFDTYYLYKKANLGFSLAQTNVSTGFNKGFYVQGNTLIGQVDTGPGFMNYQTLGLFDKDPSNANSYILTTECNTNIATGSLGGQNYFGSKLLANGNTILTFWASNSNGIPILRRHDRNGNSWTQIYDQKLNLPQLASIPAGAFKWDIPYNNNHIIYTTAFPYPSATTQVSNIYQMASNGGYQYIGNVVNPMNISGYFSGMQNNFVIVNAAANTVYLHSFETFDGNRITIDTNQYTSTLTPISLGAVDPAYTAQSNTTMITKVQQPYTTAVRDLWRYSSNLGVTSYQLPLAYSDSKLNRYMANLTVPGYVYANTGANTFQLTRIAGGPTALGNLITANIKLADGVTNSTANVARVSYYLGTQLANNSTPQLKITIDGANYTGNLPYNYNLATVNNFATILSIPGYTVSTISNGNISIRSNTYTTVGNIEGNIQQDYYQNTNPPNITRISFNNGNTAEIPDPMSPTISIDFGNTFGYNPDPFVVTLPWNSNANVVANTIRNQSLIGGNISGTGPNVNINATNPGLETEPVITFGGNGSANLSANNTFYPGSGNIDYMILGNTTFALPQNANPSQTIVHLLGNYYSDDYRLIRTGANVFGLLNLQSGNYQQPQVTTTSNTQSITSITFAPGSNAVFTTQDQTIDLGPAPTAVSNIILLS